MLRIDLPHIRECTIQKGTLRQCGITRAGNIMMIRPKFAIVILCELNRHRDRRPT